MQIVGCLPQHQLVVEYQASDLNALSARSICRGLRVNKGSMRSAVSESLGAVGRPFTSAVEALEKHKLVGRHILHVVELVFVGRSNSIGLALGFVSFSGGHRGGIR